MVLQTPARNLLPYATARQNIAFAQRLRAVSRRDRRAEVSDLLDSVGMGDQADRPARVMSGGQQQRLALAVALAGRPAVLLGDEPTSQLDLHTGDAVIALMLAARERHGTALVVVTHDHHVSDALDVEYATHDGSLVAVSWLASAAARRREGPDDGTDHTAIESIGDDPWAEAAMTGGQRPVVELVGKQLRLRRSGVQILLRHRHRPAQRRAGGTHRPLRLGQDDPAERARRCAGR